MQSKEQLENIRRFINGETYIQGCPDDVKAAAKETNSKCTLSEERLDGREVMTRIYGSNEDKEALIIATSKRHPRLSLYFIIMKMMIATTFISNLPGASSLGIPPYNSPNTLTQNNNTALGYCNLLLAATALTSVAFYGLQHAVINIASLLSNLKQSLYHTGWQDKEAARTPQAIHAL